MKIATAADFNGSRWTVMAVRTPVPKGNTFLLPVGSIMRLFKIQNGNHALRVVSAPPDLDVVASRTADRCFLHVLNLNSRAPVNVHFQVIGHQIKGGRVHEIAPADLRASVDQDNPKLFSPREKSIPLTSPPRWAFPAASVSTVELELTPSPQTAMRLP